MPGLTAGFYYLSRPRRRHNIYIIPLYSNRSK